MQYKIGNIWDHSDGWIVVTTNMMIKNNNTAVMGAGIAKEAATRNKELPAKLATHIHRRGTALFYCKPYICLPTKIDWKDNSIIELIEDGCKELADFGELLTQLNCRDQIYLPQLGCGLGGLNWEREVRPIVDSILDSDRFVLVSRE